MKTPAPQRTGGRRKLAAAGNALPAQGGSPPSFPIPNVDYLRRAIRSVGRAPASKRPALGALIRKRAKELKAANAPGVKGTWAFQGASDAGPAVELVGPKGYEHGWIKVGVSEHDAPEEKADKMSANAFRHGDGTQDALQGHRDAAKAHRAAASLSSSPARSAYHAKMATLHSRVASGRMTSNRAEDQAHGLGLRVTRAGAPDLSTRAGRAAAVAKADIGTPAGRALVARAQRASIASAPITRLAGEHGKVIEMATARMPKVRGAADVQMRRAGPGTITVQHKSTGMKVGTLAAKGRGWQGMHASGVKTPASGSQQGALAGLIAVHNRLAVGSKSPMAMVPAQQMGSAVAASNDAGKAVDLAGSLPVTSNASSSDGPRVTTAGSSGSGSSASSGPSGLSPYAAALYKKFIAKGMKPAVAMAFAKRADAMHAKAAKAA